MMTKARLRSAKASAALNDAVVGDPGREQQVEDRHLVERGVGLEDVDELLRIEKIGVVFARRLRHRRGDLVVQQEAGAEIGCLFRLARAVLDCDQRRGAVRLIERRHGHAAEGLNSPAIGDGEIEGVEIGRALRLLQVAQRDAHVGHIDGLARPEDHASSDGRECRAGHRHVFVRLCGRVGGVDDRRLEPDDIEVGSAVKEKLVHGLRDMRLDQPGHEHAAKFALVFGEAEQPHRLAVAVGLERMGEADNHGDRGRCRRDRVRAQRQLFDVKPGIGRVTGMEALLGRYLGNQADGTVAFAGVGRHSVDGISAVLQCDRARGGIAEASGRRRDGQHVGKCGGVRSFSR